MPKQVNGRNTIGEALVEFGTNGAGKDFRVYGGMIGKYIEWLASENTFNILGILKVNGIDVQSARSITPEYSTTPSVNVTNINEALAEAEAGGFEIVYLPDSPDGVVEIDAPILITRKVSFLGTGRGSKLKASDDFVGNGLIELKTYAEHTTHAEQFTCGNMTLEGNLDSQKVLCTFDGATNVVERVAHGLSNEDKIRLADTLNVDDTSAPSADGNLPTALTKYKTYFIINKTDDTFQVSLSLNGSAVTFVDAVTPLLTYYYPCTRDGIYINCDAAHYENVNDNFGFFHNMYINYCSRNGVHIADVTTQNARALYFNTLTIKGSGECGLQTYGTDSFFANINEVACGLFGFHVRGGNNAFENIKSFYSPTGVLLGDGSISTRMNNVDTQECLDIGFRLLSTRSTRITNLVSESNGHSGDGTDTLLGIGIELSTCYDSYIQGTVNNRDGLAGTIKYATRWYNPLNTGNVVDIKVPSIPSATDVTGNYDTGAETPIIGNELIVDGIDILATTREAITPGTLADGAGTEFTITLTGAIVGDFVLSSFDNDLIGVILTSWVSVADTTTVRFQNETGAEVSTLGTNWVNVKLLRK